VLLEALSVSFPSIDPIVTRPAPKASSTLACKSAVSPERSS
jgi:hypothetical protein